MPFKKQIFRLTIFSLTITLFSAYQKVEKGEKDRLTFFAQVDRWEKEGNINYLVIITTLANSSSDTISYISMSCSWEDPYTTNTKDLAVYMNICEKNVPRLIKIPPHSKQNTVLKLTSKKSINQLQKLKFKIGFNFIAAKDYNETFSKVSQLTEMKNVIWSDTLRLK